MILKARHLSKSFKNPLALTLFKDVSIEVEPGQSIAICGKSGSGKTTLLHILGTLDASDSGSIWIEGKEISSSNSAEMRNRHIGFIFQSFNLLEDFTLLENVLLPQKIARKNGDRTLALYLLERVGLLEKADMPVKLLSGGEKQRAAIARALSNDPSLILADEPTGNLDRENGLAVGALLLELVKERKKGLILVTHDPELASQCSQKYLLKNGSITAF